MEYYIKLFIAVIIGQTFLAAMSAWVFQRKNDAIDYWTALRVYLRKEIGTFIVILSFTGLVMFVLSDFMDLTKSRAELIAQGELNKFEQAQKFFRTVAVLYGVFAQWLAYLFYKGGRKAIEEYGKEKGIDLDLNKPKP